MSYSNPGSILYILSSQNWKGGLFLKWFMVGLFIIRSRLKTCPFKCDFIHSIICNYLSLFVTTTEKEASGNVSVSMDTHKVTVDSMYVTG